MFSLLQVLDLVPAFAIPPYQLLMPFGEKSLLRLPNLRNITSARGLGHFAIDIFQLPLSRLYCFLYLRPVLETRIYRLIRRRLPKPDRPDKLSAHVAMENEIVEWISPNLGKRSREEILRSQLSLTEDILFELVTLRRWIMELFRWRQSAKKTFLKYIHWYSQEQKTESLHRRVEQLRRDIDAELTAENGPSPSIRAPARSRPRRAVENSNLPSPALEDGELRQILTGEDQRFAQSPIQLREDHLLDIPNADRILLDDEVIDRTNNHQPHQPEPELAPRLRSRANSLFSQSSSPDLSPLASPLVRASLIHQNPDVITMQLELLQRTNSRNANNQSQGNRSSGGIESAGDARPNVEQQNIAINQASELLDMIITSHTQNHPAVAPRFHEELNTSMPTTTISTAGPETIQPIPAIVPIQPNNLAAAELQTAEHPLVAQNTQETETQGASPSQRPSTRRRTRPATGRTLEHRVTILSMHAVDSLSSHGAMILTTIILYPLETLALRSIAKSYLSSPAFRSMLPRGASTSLINVGLHGGTATYSVRSLGCWFGGGSLSNRLTYISKLLLAVGLEAIVRAAIWGVGTTVAMFIGRKKFGWGEL